MHLEWMLHPLTQYALLAAGLMLCLALYVNCQRQTGATRTRVATQSAAFEEAIDKLQAQLAALTEKLNEVETLAQNASAPAVPQRGMNLTKRTQVLKMHRRGERPEQIAAALGLAPAEVDLLLKVHLAMVEAN